MVIKKIEGKTTCLYRKLVWRGVELSHCDLISVLHGSCLFILCFHADWRASNCIIARNSLSFYNHIKVIKKAHKCFGLLTIPSRVLVNILQAIFTAWSEIPEALFVSTLQICQ